MKSERQLYPFFHQESDSLVKLSLPEWLNNGAEVLVFEDDLSTIFQLNKYILRIQNLDFFERYLRNNLTAEKKFKHIPCIKYHLFSQSRVCLSMIFELNNSASGLLHTFFRSLSRQSFQESSLEVVASLSRHLDTEEQKHVSDVIIWSPACDRPAAQAGVCRTALITQKKNKQTNIKTKLKLS